MQEEIYELIFLFLNADDETRRKALSFARTISVAPASPAEVS